MSGKMTTTAAAAEAEAAGTGQQQQAKRLRGVASSSHSPLPPPSSPLDDTPSGADYVATQNVLETPREPNNDLAVAPTPRPASSSSENVGTTTLQSRSLMPPQASLQFQKWDVPPEYQLVKVLGHGSYGEVAEATHRPTQRRVAIKRIHNVFDLELDTKRIVREMYILRQLRNEHIVRLLDILAPRDRESFNELYLVFEFVETDLHKLIMSPQYLTIDHIRYLMYQLLCALKYIHSANVIHRDIKPANILLNEDCSLKVCDFGLSRVLRVVSPLVTSESLVSSNSVPGGGAAADTTTTSSSSSAAAISSTSHKIVEASPTKGTAPSGKAHPLQRQLTKHVVTRWYRPPELILLQDYATPVDVWSVGCIFAELLSMQKESVPVYANRTALFPGRSCFPLSADNDKTYKDQLDQLNVIFEVIGTPSAEDVSHLGDVQQYLRSLSRKEPKKFNLLYPAAPPEAIDLLVRMLAFNPDKRITVEEALNHPFLASDKARYPDRQKMAEHAVMSLEEITSTSNGLRRALLDEIDYYERRKHKME